ARHWPADPIETLKSLSLESPERLRSNLLENYGPGHLLLGTKEQLAGTVKAEGLKLPSNTLFDTAKDGDHLGLYVTTPDSTGFWQIITLHFAVLACRRPRRNRIQQSDGANQQLLRTCWCPVSENT